MSGGREMRPSASARAYYNEIDPYAAQWLRNLIAGGHIAPGDVDERSIVDVRPSDLEGYAQCHFFAGIGGWSYAARLAGWPDDRPLWTGSCPCQPFSVAGAGKAQADDRHLWPVFFDLIRACRPDVVFGEQVAVAAGARPQEPFDLQRAVEAMAREKSGAFEGYRAGQPFGQPRGEHDLGCEEARAAEEFAVRLGRLQSAADGTNRSRIVRADGSPVQSHSGSAGLEQPLAGSGEPGTGLRDRERAGGAVRGECDDADVGAGEDAGNHGRAEAQGVGEGDQLSGEVREELGAPTARDWLDGVQSDFQGIAYTSGTAIVPCCAVNAPHRRDRLWFVADSHGSRSLPSTHPRIHRSQEGPGPRHGEPERCGVSGDDVADSERAGLAQRERIARVSREVGGKPEGQDLAHDDSSMGHANQFGPGSERPERSGQLGGAGLNSWSRHGWLAGADGKARRVEPGIRLLAHGVPARVGKLRAYGNAIVPQVAAEVIGAYLDTERLSCRVRNDPNHPGVAPSQTGEQAHG